jgi:PAS domain S-box-containing protein
MIEENEPGSERTVEAPVNGTDQLKRHETELTRLDEPLHDPDRAKTEFVANISRDFRTPLSLLLGPLQDILASPASALAPGSRTVLEVARRNALRLLNLLDTLPDSSWIEGGRTSAAREPADLAAFTAELIGNFRSFCEGAGLSLIVDCPPLPEQVYVDRDAWEKIVVNLVANAFKSTVEGTIEVRLRAQDGSAQLIVSDTGAGIPGSEMRYVFDHFDHVSRAHTGTSDRIGFGLPLVRELVHLHNGSINVQSTLGRGTSFTVLLPLGARHVSPRAGGPGPAESGPVSTANHGSAVVAQALPAWPEGGVATDAHVPKTDAVLNPRGHVVIAEDHAETRVYLCYVLEAAGFTVDALADGTAALATCQARAPDALVSDVLMPGLDGFELIERLRGDERTAVIPVLLLSAHSGEDLRIAGIAAGADDYLVKPLSGRELVARVDGAVRLARLRRETARREQADLEALFSMAPDGVIVVGHNGRVLTANEQARQLFGYAPQEFLGLQVEALMPASHRPAHVGHRDTYVRAPVVRLMNPLQELRGVRRDGSEFIAEIGLGPLQFKNQACTIAIVRDISERKKLETERAEQEKRFRDLSGRLVEVQEAERRELSAELHDRTSPQLAAIQINLNMLRNMLRTHETEDVRALLDDTVGLIADTTVSIREISSNLRPTVLDDGGLLPALAGYAQQFTQRTGIVVQLHTQDATSTLSPAVQSSLFRIVQEALTNCVKHAKAKNVTIRLSTDRSHLVSLMIADDGTGFDLERQSTAGLGLLTMRERAEFIGGRFSLETKPGQGTRIRVLV